MWKGNELRFVEVKAPGDRISKSQRVILEEFAKPLRLDFALVEVEEETHCEQHKLD
ncbi:hypothetical protein RNAN_3478 [Rheinheimera nanhaiensis E407-8]|uniref:VRR-NUC domain-containing protein n=2 Tax=Rheinheimera TaxID=67575 RepID=I1E2C6_9GAMM|nr:hypothetical protein RNAN_3478 [Rheinheimera nanhaiensis E407-8]